MVDLDPDQAVEKGHAEGETADCVRQARAESERVAVVAHAAQTLHQGQPRAGQRAHVHAVAHVVLEVAQVHESCLT